MITKEQFIDKYCCFYVSDFHLEMILLPYIKDNLQKAKITIMTEESLENSLRVLLKKVNMKDSEKTDILNLNWNRNCAKIEENNCSKNIIIINGSLDYIEEKNKKIKELNLKNINIIDCYNINKFNINVLEIKKEYKSTLNTGLL